MNLAEYLAIKSNELGALTSDMNRIIYSKKTGEEKYSRKSLEHVTKLRKNTQELKEAAARDKDEQFVLDQLNKIFGE